METGKIFALIPKIMAEVGHIAKERKSGGTGPTYAFRGVDDVYFAMQPLFAKHGVFCSPHVLNLKREERESRGGSAINYTILEVEFAFYADDGSCFRAVTVGEAMDSSDKSSNKAMSAAFKYVMLQVFCIPVDGDNDTENSNHEVLPRSSTPSPVKPLGTPTTHQTERPKHPSDAQIRRLYTIATACKVPNEVVKDYCEKEFKISSSRDLTLPQYDQLVHQIESGRIMGGPNL